MSPTAAALPRLPRILLAALLGGAFGFSLSRIGFTDYGELHKMFQFKDLRMFLTFAGGVMVSAGAYRALRRARPLPPRPFHRGTVIGGVIFGLGWAVAGACPGVAFAQIGEGKLFALVTLAGILIGSWAYPKVHSRYFRFDRGSCG